MLFTSSPIPALPPSIGCGPVKIGITLHLYYYTRLHYRLKLGLSWRSAPDERTPNPFPNSPSHLHSPRQNHPHPPNPISSLKPFSSTSQQLKLTVKRKNIFLKWPCNFPSFQIMKNKMFLENCDGFERRSHIQ